MRNHGDETITLYAGHRIAQMVIARTEYLEPIEAKISANDSERGEGAFGSTGKNNVNGLTKYATDKQTDTQPLKNVKFLLLSLLLLLLLLRGYAVAAQQYLEERA